MQRNTKNMRKITPKMLAKINGNPQTSKFEKPLFPLLCPTNPNILSQNEMANVDARWTLYLTFNFTSFTCSYLTILTA